MDDVSHMHRISLSVLGSGSKGNASVVHGPDGDILIDAGFSARSTLQRMRDIGVDPSRIRAILVTHDHSDHIGGLGPVARTLGVPVVASPSCARTLSRRCGVIAEDALTPHWCGTVAGIEIRAFRTSHDAGESFGFRFETRTDALGYATDTGTLTGEAFEALGGCRILAIESNHDEQMLRTGPYPLHLKRRIASDHGHLSNAQTAHALESLAGSRLESVVALHLSETNNLPAVCSAALTAALEGLGHPARVTVSGQNRPRRIE